VIELDVEEIGPSLRYATAKVSKQNGRGSKAAAGSGARGGSSGGAADRSVGGSARASGIVRGERRPATVLATKTGNRCSCHNAQPESTGRFFGFAFEEEVCGAWVAGKC
jgi:hypothetical protein